jgi:hypothetical protein
MRRQWLVVAAVGVPPLVLAGLGLVHPPLLTVETAAWFTALHYLLMPLFALLGVVVWVLLRNDRSAVGWAGRVAAVAYVVFYTGLDSVSGIGAGTAVLAGADPKSEVVVSMFEAGRPLGVAGAYALFVAIILVLASQWRAGQRGWLFYGVSVVALVSGYLFTSGHIYWPKGVVAMLGLALSLSVVAALAELRARRARSAPV